MGVNEVNEEIVRFSEASQIVREQDMKGNPLTHLITQRLAGTLGGLCLSMCLSVCLFVCLSACVCRLLLKLRIQSPSYAPHH